MIASELQSRLLERLGDNPATGGFYTPQEALAWLNAAQRIMVLLTLCLETTASISLTANVSFYRMLNLFSDWLLPLRVRIDQGQAPNNGAKVLPARLSDLAALDSNWSVSPGPVTRYAHLGFDLLAVYRRPLAVVAIQVTYARCPAPMINPADVPQVPLPYHPVLIDGAIPLCRAKEGGGEWKKTLPQWDRFMDACQKLGAYVRARNKEQGYDRLPMEIERYDRTQLLQKGAA